MKKVIIHILDSSGSVNLAANEELQALLTRLGIIDQFIDPYSQAIFLIQAKPCEEIKKTTEEVKTDSE